MDRIPKHDTVFVYVLQGGGDIKGDENKAARSVAALCDITKGRILTLFLA